MNRAFVGDIHQPRALVVGVVELAERVAYLHAGDEALETLDEARVVRSLLGERAGLERMLGDEHRLDELGLDALAEQLVDLSSPGRRQRHRAFEALGLDRRLKVGDRARIVGAELAARIPDITVAFQANFTSPDGTVREAIMKLATDNLAAAAGADVAGHWA